MDPLVYRLLRDRARRKLPTFAFDFVDGGAGLERASRRNIEDLAQTTIQPLLPISMETVVLDCVLFGQRYDAPVGIAPIGMTGILHPKADLALAEAASRANVPYILSSAASTRLIDIARRTGIAPWFQLYAPRRTDLTQHLVSSAAAVGCPVLVLTIDMPTPGLRLRDLRHRLNLGCPSWPMVLSALKHPLWTARRLTAGPLTFPNFEDPNFGERAHSATVSFQSMAAEQVGGQCSWDFIRAIRDQWSGALVLKGVLNLEVVEMAHKCGIDGVIISNHGGRQLDCAPSSISVLKGFPRDFTPDVIIMADSGVRSGEDVLKLITHGAACAFVGRPLLYAIGALGPSAATEALAHLIHETRRAFALAGRQTASAPVRERVAAQPVLKV